MSPSDLVESGPLVPHCVPQDGLSTSIWSPGVISHIQISTLGRQRSARELTLCGFQDPTLDLHSCAAHRVRALPTGPSPQPESYLSNTNVHFYCVRKNKEKCKCRLQCLTVVELEGKEGCCPDAGHAASICVNGLAC